VWGELAERASERERERERERGKKKGGEEVSSLFLSLPSPSLSLFFPN
jgi:hypothetical protein